MIKVFKNTVFFAVVVLAACSPRISNYGNGLTQTKLGVVVPMESTRADVEQQWGPPSTVSPFNPNVWYYMSETTAQKGIFEAQVQKRQLIRVTFNDQDQVVSIAQLDPHNGREVNFVDRTTPTAGKEYTAVQQIIGNLGKYNKPAEQ